MDETEMEEERRLAYVGITRAEEMLYLTNAKMITIFGRTNMALESRFLQEIPEDLIEKVGSEERSFSSYGRERMGQPTRTAGGSATPRLAPKKSGAETLDWQVGDKAEHKKWGIGTVVSMKGEGKDLELTIAFDSPTGLKRLLAEFAPISKV